MVRAYVGSVYIGSLMHMLSSVCSLARSSAPQTKTLMSSGGGAQHVPWQCDGQMLEQATGWAVHLGLLCDARCAVQSTFNSKRENFCSSSSTETSVRQPFLHNLCGTVLMLRIYDVCVHQLQPHMDASSGLQAVNVAISTKRAAPPKAPLQ